MNNVTQIRPSASIFSPDSPLYFKVCERVDGWQNKHGTWHADPTQKKLLRQDPVTDEPIILATVGNKYQTVQNRELFGAVEDSMSRIVPAQYLDGATRSEKLSYGGAVGLHDYSFPQMRVAFNEADISFRIVARNGYGTVAVNLFAGGFDGYCLNGCVWGVAEKHYRRHTSGLQISGIDEVIQKAIENFWIEANRLKRLADIDSPLNVEAFLQTLPKMSKRLASKLRAQYVREADERGHNMWALFSAMTCYATHNNVVPMRNTGRDHDAATRIARSEQVAAWTRSKEWKALAA